MQRLLGGRRCSYFGASCGAEAQSYQSSAFPQDLAYRVLPPRVSTVDPANREHGVVCRHDRVDLIQDLEFYTDGTPARKVLR
jgi:hypothetical protein